MSMSIKGFIFQAYFLPFLYLSLCDPQICNLLPWIAITKLNHRTEGARKVCSNSLYVRGEYLTPIDKQDGSSIDQN